MPLEQDARLARGGMRLRVLAERNQALDPAVERPRHVHVASRASKQLGRGVVVFERPRVFAANEAHMPLRPDGARPRQVVVERVGDRSRGQRQSIGLLHVHPREPHDASVQLFDHGGIDQVAVAAKEAGARARRADSGELIDQHVARLRPAWHLRSPGLRASAGDA
jgi:hypothetical protein